MCVHSVVVLAATVRFHEIPAVEIRGSAVGNHGIATATIVASSQDCANEEERDTHSYHEDRLYLATRMCVCESEEEEEEEEEEERDDVNM